MMNRTPEEGMPVRKANATWEGGLPGGRGRMRMESGAYEGAYSFGSRFQEDAGTNPEELLAAAHAGCFSMAFSGALERAGHTPERIDTTARVHIEKGSEGFDITKIELDCVARVSGLDEAKFQEIGEGAKKGCPVSKLFKGADIRLNARLEA
jgi:lipoyl-dependent peroxiredoxin